MSSTKMCAPGDDLADYGGFWADHWNVILAEAPDPDLPALLEMAAYMAAGYLSPAQTARLAAHPSTTPEVLAVVAAQFRDDLAIAASYQAATGQVMETHMSAMASASQLGAAIVTASVGLQEPAAIAGLARTVLDLPAA